MELSPVAGACYPLSVLPGLSRLALDAVAGELPDLFPTNPTGFEWMAQTPRPVAPGPALADLLQAQNQGWQAGPAALAHLARLRAGARAIVTGQQVALFGGPLYTLHKAAGAVRLATEATRATGIPHVPIFWLATEDHDFAEIDHVAFPSLSDAPHALTTVRLGHHPDAHAGKPVGGLPLGTSIGPALAEAASLLGEHSEAFALLADCYRPETTFADAFAQWLAATFREQGLLVFNAAGHEAHALGADVLRAAIEHAAELEELLLARGAALEARGYHQQVLVKPGRSLLFLLDGTTGARLPLAREPGAGWIAGSGRASQVFSTRALLDILASEPERLSPNALLRPVFQDAILPTAAYIGGPAEIAYFAQTGVLAQRILGRQTPVLPRLSATLLTEREFRTMEHDEIDLPELFTIPEREMTERIGARHLPPEGKRRLQAAGQSMHGELEALTEWMRSLDPALGRSAEVAASKMRYQMNRLRRLAAHRELERNTAIARRIGALYRGAYPDGHLQERVTGAAGALARFGPDLPGALVAAAGEPCPGHKLIVR